MSWHGFGNCYFFAEMYTTLFIAEQKYLTVDPEKSDQYCAILLSKKK